MLLKMFLFFHSQARGLHYSLFTQARTDYIFCSRKHNVEMRRFLKLFKTQRCEQFKACRVRRQERTSGT